MQLCDIIKKIVEKGKVIGMDKAHCGTRIIAFEGIDGTGKTVQISYLKQKLESMGYRVGMLSFPNYEGFFGRELGRMLSGDGKSSADKVDAKSMCLWYALDRFKTIGEIRLNEYDFLLLNRFTLSNVVYQSIRADERKREEMVDWILQLEHDCLKLPVPDMYMVFDVEPETSKKNVANKGYRDYVGDREDVYEKSRDLMDKARKMYRSLAGKLGNITIIDCMDRESEMKSPLKINEEVLDALKSKGIIQA